MKEVYQQIKDIDSKDQCTVSEAICKFNEEFGEMVCEINKTTGRKLSDDTDEQIRANILEEGADSLQNLYLILSRFGFTFEEISQEIARKNGKWESQVEKRQAKKRSLMGEV